MLCFFIPIGLFGGEDYENKYAAETKKLKSIFIRKIDNFVT